MTSNTGELQISTNRDLGGTYYSPYFKDSKGNEYESYATAWRYLGVYLDCGSSRRDLRSNRWYSSYTYKSGCSRKLLWAGYQNLNYSGGSIGEYQFYDLDAGKWDDSTCKSSSCTKMDCHDPSSANWQLVGVFKESVEFDNDTWFEQLFKHQGYCLWDGDKEGSNVDYTNSDYQFMQAMREAMPDGCTKTTVFGGTKYIDIKPLSYGQMTLGVYTDSKCQKDSSYSFSDYRKKLSGGAMADNNAFDTWNQLMDQYKICQPCRAYNREYTYQYDWRRGRDLAEKSDGQGEAEPNGFNCYDDAGYRK